MNERDTLSELSKAYDAFLSALDTASPASDAFVVAWRRCERGCADLAPLDTLLARVPEEDRDVCGELLARVQRMHAIAVQSVIDQAKGTQGLLAAARRERRSLGFYVPDGDTGVSCDVSG